jgi:site-specific recombinase XerD
MKKKRVNKGEERERRFSHDGERIYCSFPIPSKVNREGKTVESYYRFLERFENQFGERSIDSIGSDERFQFLETFTGNNLRCTRRLRYAQLKAFFNFLIDKCSLNMKNPCKTSLMPKPTCPIGAS